MSKTTLIPPRFWDRKTILLTFALVMLGVSAVAAATTRMVILMPQHYQVIEQNTFLVGKGEPDYLTVEVHSTLRQYRWIDGERYLIFSYAHPGQLTTIGKNFTAMKISGNAGWPFNDEALYNVTYISLGHDVGLDDDSTELPGEWNRTLATFEYLGLGNWNYTASFYPDGSGTTNATGLCWKSGIGTDTSTWAYDTFSTITYTSADQIDVEFEVTVSDT